MLYCSNCGSKIAEGAKLCSNCGKIAIQQPVTQRKPNQQEHQSATPQQYSPKPITPKMSSPMSKIGAIVGMIGIIFAGAGTMFFAVAFATSEYEVARPIFLVTFILIGVGMILIGIGHGLYHLGKT